MAVASALDLIVVSEGFRDVGDLEAAPIRILNPRLLGRLGLSAAEVEGWVGRPLGDFFRRYVEDPDALAGFFDRLLLGRVVEDAAFRLVCGDRSLEVGGQGRIISGSAEGHYFLGVFQDLTGQRLLEARLRREQGDRVEWDTFLRHELRGKLGPVIGFSDLLISNFEKFSEDRIKEFLKSIHDSGQRLNEILDHTREFQAYERGEIEAAWTEQDLYETVRNAAEEAGLAVRGAKAGHPTLWGLVSHAQGEPLPLLHDPLKVQRALRNLIQNAWEHSPEPVTLRVEAGVDGARIHIHNKGEPIEPERLAGIFEKFNSTKSGRMGLGTTLSRLLVEAHGGRILASSGEAGTTFTVWLPRKNSETASVKREA
jgi:signal transduction histidine kinase